MWIPGVAEEGSHGALTEAEDTEQRRYLNRELSWLDFNSQCWLRLRTDGCHYWSG